MTTPTSGPAIKRASRPVSARTSYPSTAPKAEKKDEPPARPKAEVPPERPGPVARWVADKYRWIGGLWEPVDPVCGATVVAAADAAGMAWQRAYKNSPFIRNVLDQLMKSSIAGELFFAHLPILMAVMMHHNPGFRDYMSKSSLAILTKLPQMPDIPDATAEKTEDAA